MEALCTTALRSLTMPQRYRGNTAIITQSYLSPQMLYVVTTTQNSRDPAGRKGPSIVGGFSADQWAVIAQFRLPKSDQGGNLARKEIAAVRKLCHVETATCLLKQ